MYLDIVYVAIGSMIGGVLRYILSKCLTFSFYNIVVINIIGSIILAHLNIVKLNKVQKLLLMTGFCGSFTTFSTYIVEILKLFKSGKVYESILYFLFSNIISLASAFYIISL